MIAKGAKPVALLVTSQINHTVREYNGTTGAFVRWLRPATPGRSALAAAEVCIAAAPAPWRWLYARFSDRRTAGGQWRKQTSLVDEDPKSSRVPRV